MFLLEYYVIISVEPVWCPTCSVANPDTVFWSDSDPIEKKPWIRIWYWWSVGSESWFPKIRIWIQSKNPNKNSNIIPLDWVFSSDLDISFCWRSGADRIFLFSQNWIHFFRIRSISIRILNTANLFSDYHAMINPEPSFLAILISCHQTNRIILFYSSDDTKQWCI